MRKFNLKGTVVQRMKGITRDDPKPVHTEATNPDGNELYPVFSAEQGCFQYAWRTDVGRLRKNNQDAVILGNGLAGVADGMGGHKGGEIASAGLRDGLLRETKNCRPDSETLNQAVKTVNRELWMKQESDASLSGMGTTLTVLWPKEEEMIIGQIGDSRAYLLRDGEIKQMTNDHSMVADMVRKGVLTEEQAACHPMRNYITRAVGTDEYIELDLSTCDRKKGDRWLICSDGLYGMLLKSQLLQMMMIENLEEAAEKLLQAALAAGGKDNISLVIIQDNTESETAEKAEGERNGDLTDEPATSEEVKKS